MEDLDLLGGFKGLAGAVQSVHVARGASVGTIEAVSGQLSSVLLSTVALSHATRLLTAFSPASAVGRATFGLFLATAVEFLVAAGPSTAAAAAAAAAAPSVAVSGAVVVTRRVGLRVATLLRQYATVVLGFVLGVVLHEAAARSPPLAAGDGWLPGWTTVLPWELVVFLVVSPVLADSATLSGILARL